MIDDNQNIYQSGRCSFLYTNFDRPEVAKLREHEWSAPREKSEVLKGDIWIGNF